MCLAKAEIQMKGLSHYYLTISLMFKDNVASMQSHAWHETFSAHGETAENQELTSER